MGKNLLAPYSVQMREYERRLLLAALEHTGGDRALAAEMLGVHEAYITARALFLGGVLPGDPKHEPPAPGAVRQAWDKSGHTEVSNARRARKSATTTITMPNGRTVVARDRVSLTEDPDDA